MKLSIELDCPSSKEWIDAVMEDFDSFLQDHANCERKASSMAMSFVAKYPDRKEIIPELIETAVEELEHFQQVYTIMEERGVELPHQIGQDLYVKIIIPEDSGLTYNEAWTFMRGLLVKYDYYYQE